MDNTAFYAQKESENEVTITVLDLRRRYLQEWPQCVEVIPDQRLVSLLQKSTMPYLRQNFVKMHSITIPLLELNQESVASGNICIVSPQCDKTRLHFTLLRSLFLINHTACSSSCLLWSVVGQHLMKSTSSRPRTDTNWEIHIEIPE